MKLKDLQAGLERLRSMGIPEDTIVMVEIQSAPLEARSVSYEYGVVYISSRA